MEAKSILGGAKNVTIRTYFYDKRSYVCCLETVIAAKKSKTGEYAVWTSWNEKIQNLNFGHYCLKPKAEIVLDIFDNAFFDGFSEIKKAVKAESEEEND